MNTPKAILIGFALVAAAVYFSRDVGPAQAALEVPKFQISNTGSEKPSLFKLNVDTGEVAMCVVRPGSGSPGDFIITCSKFQ